MRTIYEQFAVVRYVSVVVDLVDALVELFLDRSAVAVRVRIVGCVDDFLFESLQDVNRGAYCTLSNFHHAAAVLRVAVSLVETADLNAHALGNRIARCVISSTVDLHAGRNLCQALRQCIRVLVQSVQRRDCRHVVFNYHTHDNIPP